MHTHVHLWSRLHWGCRMSEQKREVVHDIFINVHCMPYPISHGHWLKQDKFGLALASRTHLVWLPLCKIHPISFPDCKIVCVQYWVSGNKTSSTPNPSASIYSQSHIFRFPCNMLVNRISTGEGRDDVDRFCNHWQISTVVEKAFHIFQWLLSWLLHK